VVVVVVLVEAAAAAYDDNYNKKNRLTVSVTQVTEIIGLYHVWYLDPVVLRRTFC
jgi:hypothetical protein